MKKTMFVVGAGKGLGNAVARRFAADGFRVVLMCRSEDRLADYRREMQAEGIDVAVQVVDAADQTALAETIKQAVRHYGVPDVLFYNVGNTTADGDLSGGMNVAVMQQRYQVDVLGAYTCIRQMLNNAFSQKQGAILITGGGLALYPSADYLPLSMDKAALRALVLALHPVCLDQGVFLGVVQVCGTIGGSEKYRPEKVADQFWKLYQNRGDAEIVY